MANTHPGPAGPIAPGRSGDRDELWTSPGPGDAETGGPGYIRTSVYPRAGGLSITGRARPGPLQSPEAHPGFRGGDSSLVLAGINSVVETDHFDRQPRLQGRPAM